MNTRIFRFGRQAEVQATASPAPPPLPPQAVVPAVPQAARAVENVTAGAVGTVHYRAIVRRNLDQVAVVEFDADEGVDQYLIARDLAGQIPEDAWSQPTVRMDYDGNPSVYIDNLAPVAVDAAAADPVADAEAAAAAREDAGITTQAR